MLHISTSRLNGMTLVGRARDHVVLSDRAIADGGADFGCTSGELMLLAVGSCVVGSLNLFAASHGADLGHLSADVRVEETPGAGYGPIAVEVTIGSEVPPDLLDALCEAAGSGRVTGRLRQGSEVRVTVSCDPGAPAQKTAGCSPRSPAGGTFGS